MAFDEGLDILMGQLMRFRETSDRMTMEQRRDVAEHLAHKLLASFGADDEDL